MLLHNMSELKVILTVHNIGVVKTRITAINLGMSFTKLIEILISIPAFVFIEDGEHEVFFSVRR